MATASIEVRIPTSQLVRILIVDDEIEVRETLKERLEAGGYAVDTAEYPETACELLRTNEYQVIIADQVFGDRHMYGDEFIIQNEELMAGARKVIITGRGPAAVHHRDQLEQMGVSVLIKGGERSEFLERLRSIASEQLTQVRHKLTERMQGVAPTLLNSRGEPQSDVSEMGASHQLLERVKKILLRSLEKMQDPDRKQVFFAGREYSPAMLMHEIQEGTDVGLAHLDMVVDLLEDDVEIEGE